MELTGFDSGLDVSPRRSEEIRMTSRILITVFAEIWNILGGTGL